MASIKGKEWRKLSGVIPLGTPLSEEDLEKALLGKIEAAIELTAIQPPTYGTGFNLDIQSISEITGRFSATGVYVFGSTFIYDGEQESKLFEIIGSYSVTDTANPIRPRAIARSSYTDKDLKNMGMNVRHDADGAPYLDTPYGKCYLRNEPGYREE